MLLIFKIIFILVPANVTPITPSPVVGVEGSSVLVKFNITQADPLVKVENIRWQFSFLGTDIDITESSSGHYQLSDDRRSLTINQLTTQQGGVYTMFATNEAGTRLNQIMVVIESKTLSQMLRL